MLPATDDRCPYCGYDGCICTHVWGESCRCDASGYKPPVIRPDTPIGGNAIAGFFKALGKINFRKVFKGWFR